MKPILVVKVGGAFLNSQQQATPLLDELVQLNQTHHLVLVHGGGDQVANLLSKLNLVSEKIDGLRVTPDSHMPYVAGALAGSVNKQLCAWAQTSGLNTVGLSLSDGHLIKCQQKDPKLGCVGEANANNPILLNALLNDAFVPVISSIGSDENGQLLNINADQAATAIAQLLGAQLLLLSDVKGVLDANKDIISTLKKAEIDNLCAQGVIRDGMQVKVYAALEAANTIGKGVIIASWADPKGLANISHGASFGTQIIPNSHIHS